MSTVNEVSYMLDQEFDSKMFEIFNNSDASFALRKLWELYDGDLDGCKQWLRYWKHHNNFLWNKAHSEKECLESWNGLRENNATETVRYADYNDLTNTYKRFRRVERRNDVLKELK